MMGSISWQNNFKNGYKYCETPIRKVIGVIELAREYKFNGSHSKTTKVLAVVPREYITFCAKLCLNNEQPDSLGSYIHDHVK